MIVSPNLRDCLIDDAAIHNYQQAAARRLLEAYESMRLMYDLVD